MPRKKGPKTGKTQSGTRSTHKELKFQSAQDVSIHDYANAPKPTSRPKKMNTIPAPEILDSWEQAAEDSDTVQEVDEEGNGRGVVGQRDERHEGESEYPEVVWYLVSRHVRPEDVGRFAGINRTTYALTRREGFWRALYGAWCATRPHLLPAALRARGGGTLYALRQRVVRALYHTYTPFILKLQALSAEADPSPHALVGRRCVTLWYDKRPDGWLYTFKLRHRAAPGPGGDAGGWLRRLSDLDANPELHCRALLVECEDFQSLPAAMGLLLSGASASLARSLRHQRLRLEFGSSPPAAPDLVVRLERVRRLRALDWWHPRYPHAAAARLPPAPDPADALTPPLLQRDFLS